MATRSAGHGRRGSDPACPHVLLEVAHGHALQRHRVGGEIVGVPVLEGRRAPAEVTGDHEPSPLDHLGVGGRQLLRRVVALIDHHALVLAGEVVLDDPPVHGRVADSVPQAAESGAGPRAVVVPDARPVFLDGDAHARVEIPAELRAEHAGQVMAAAPLGRPRRWDAPPGAIGEGAGEPRPVAAIGGPGPLAAVRVDVLEGVLAHVVALGHVAAETVAHEDRMLALGAAGDEATARHHHRVTVHVVHVRIHGVLEGDLPVAPPLDLTDEDEGVVVEELLGHVLLDGRGRVVPDPDKDEALEGARGIDLGLRARLAAHARVWALGEDHGVLARLVVDPAVIRAGHRALVVAVTLAETRAAVRADILDGDHVALRAPEEADLFAEQRDLDRLAMPDLAIEDGRVPVIAQAELGDQIADVAGELGHRPVGTCVCDVQPRRWRSGCRHDGLLRPSGLEQREALVGVERPRLDEVALIGLAAELLHGADQHVPIEHLLLPRALDGLQGPRAPCLVVSDAQRLVEAAVLLDVGIELVVLVGEEGVRPARGGDERRAPRAVPHHPRGGRPDLHAAPRTRRRRIERIAGDGIGEAPAASALRDDAPAVAIDLEGDDRIREADAIVIEEHDRVEEGMGQPREMERLVGVGHVHPLLEEARSQVLARRAVARDLERRLRRLGPHVGRHPGLLPRTRLNVVVGEHAEGRDHVIGEILVLVVAPHDDDVRLELIETTARFPEVSKEGVPVRRGARRPAVGAVLAPHRLGPARRIAITVGQAGILEHAAEDGRHVLVATGEGRVVCHAEAENLTHETVPPTSACKRLRNPSLGARSCQARASPQNYGYRTGGLSRRSTVTPKGVAVTRTSVREYLSKQRERYQGLRRPERSRLVTEIVAVTGYHRKAVLRCLRATPRPRAGRRPVGRPRRYGSDVARVAQVLWEAAGQIGAKRLQPFLPALLDRLVACGELTVAPTTARHLRAISTATLERVLAPARRTVPRRGRSTTQPGSWLKQQIPLRTFADWNEAQPGFLEIDLVAHCGADSSGFFLHTLCAVDITTGWVELQPIWGKGHKRVKAALHEIRGRLPVPLRGLDSDNGSEFINRPLYYYCWREGIVFTRSRPYRKNDSAHVEQKNGALVGYDRYASHAAYAQLARVYRLLRVHANFFQPVQRLVAKSRVGARVRRWHDRAQTPYQRLLAARALLPARARELQALYETLNPLQLRREIDAALTMLWRLSSREPPPASAIPLTASAR